MKHQRQTLVTTNHALEPRVEELLWVVQTVNGAVNNVVNSAVTTKLLITNTAFSLFVLRRKGGTQPKSDI